MKKNFDLFGLLMPLTALILSGCTLDKLNLSSENFSYAKSSTEPPGLRYEIIYSDEALKYIVKAPNMGFVDSRITLYTHIVYDADLVFFARNYFDLDEILFYLNFVNEFLCLYLS